jgi:hypothetical protein
VNSDGSGQRQLTNGGRAFDPAWSPDGSEIVYSSDSDGGVELYAIAADGGDARRLTSLDSSESACWPAWLNLSTNGPDLATLPSPTPGADGSLPFYRGVLVPGRHVDDTFSPAFTVEVPPGWNGSENLPDSAILSRAGELIEIFIAPAAYPTGCFTDQPTPLGSRPRDVIDFLRADRFLTATDYQNGTVDGHPAESITIELKKIPPCRFDRPRKAVLDLASGTFDLRPGDRKRVTAVDVDGLTVVVSDGGQDTDSHDLSGADVISSLHFLP